MSKISLEVNMMPLLKSALVLNDFNFDGQDGSIETENWRTCLNELEDKEQVDIEKNLRECE